MNKRVTNNLNLIRIKILIELKDFKKRTLYKLLTPILYLAKYYLKIFLNLIKLKD